MKIEILDSVISSRIAAGEVIENPSCCLRELLDNSIDAQSTAIKVYLTAGGTENITVEDNGTGMSAEDLRICTKSHATSKIKTLDDLFNLKSMGFRGEALPSICACSITEISSNGNSMVSNNGIESEPRKSPYAKGTRVSVSSLFEKLPARKLFLKRPASEEKLCIKVFLEKALAFCNIAFTLISDEKTIFNLPASDRLQRVLTIMETDSSFKDTGLLTFSGSAPNCSITVYAADSSIYKKDRSQVKIFINNRIIDNYRLTYACCNAFSAVLPGGAFPFLYIYIENRPELTDFNIHPAKRECKLRNESEVFSLATSVIRTSLLKIQEEKNSFIKTEEQKIENTPVFAGFTASEEPTEKPTYSNTASFNTEWFKEAKQNIQTEKQTQIIKQEKQRTYRYIGQAFETFLIVEKDNKIIFVDQHAAHERILYDSLINAADIQMLAIPYSFEVSKSMDDFLDKNSAIYSEYGINLLKEDNMLWQLTSVPACCYKREEEIASYIQRTNGDAEEIKKGLFAIVSCRNAIKAGQILDSTSAIELLDKVFELPALVCPHGRSFINIITKEELYKAVGRTL